MIKRTALSLAVSLAGAFPSLSLALGLGELDSSSQLNQPLRAKIELLSSSPAEARQLKVRLASPAVFNRVGISRPAYLNSLRFQPTVENGKPVIRVSSSQPINEPFLNFLLEVSWPKGQLLKEYTVLLDPPVLMQSNSGSSQRAAVRAEPQNSGVVRRQQEQARQLLAQQRAREQQAMQQEHARQQQQAQNQYDLQQQQQREREWQEQQAMRELLAEPTPRARQARPTRPTRVASARRPNRTTRYRVRRGDTLYKVAKKFRQPKVSHEQMMIALFRANPKAFRKNNINNLKSGSLMRRPSNGLIRDESRKSARQLVQQHNEDWRNFRSGAAKNTVAQADTPKQSANRRSTPSRSNDKDEANLKVVGANSRKSRPTDDESRSVNDLREELALVQERLATSQNEGKDLRDRVSKLEAILRKKDRLITLKSERIAQLEATLNDAGAETPPTQRGSVNTPSFNGNAPDIKTPSFNTPDVDVNAPSFNTSDVDFNKPLEKAGDIANDIGNEITTQAGNILRTEDDPDKQVDVIKNDASPFAGTTEDEDEGGIMSFLGSPLVTALGTGSLLGSLGLWWLMRRRKATSEYDDHDDDYIAPDFNDDVEDLDFDHQISSFDNDNKHHYDDGFDDLEHPIVDKADDVEAAMVKKSSFETAEPKKNEDDLYEDELLQEAGVYIVYGLHDQAEEELTKAIGQHPERLEYRHKLLENYQVANNKDAFLDSTADFLKAEGNNKQKLWDKVRKLGKSIAPENDLYDQKSVVAAASSLPGIGSGVGAALGTAGAAAAGAAAFVGSKAAKAGDAIGDGVGNTLSGVGDTLSNAKDAMGDGISNTLSGAGDTLSNAKDAMGDGIGNTLSGVGDKLSNAKDAVGDKLGDAGDFMLDGADTVGGKLGSVKDAIVDEAKDTASNVKNAFPDDNSLDLDLDDIGSFADDGVAKLKAKGANVSDNLDLDDLDFNDEDFNLSDLDADLKNASHSLKDKANDLDLSVNNEVEGVKLNIDQSSGIDRILPQGNTYATGGQPEKDLAASVAQDKDDFADDALSFLDLPDDDLDMQEAHISTKLDLARAYLDMGDVEGARSTLEEVVNEGNDEQRREAQQMLHQTG